MHSSRGPASFWLVRQLAPLVSLHRLVSARLALASARPAARATGLAPRWFSSGRATSLSPRWSARVGPLVSTGSARAAPLASLCSSGQALVSTGSARAAPLASLRSSGYRCVHLLHDLRCVHLLHDSVPWWLVRRSRAALVRSPGLLALTAFRHSSSAPLSPPRARTPLEFGRSRQSHTCGHLVLTVPRVQVKRRPSASSHTHSDGPVSQTCLLPTLKGES